MVTTLSRTVGHTWDLVRSYGFSSSCAGVHACGVPVLDLESESARAALRAEVALRKECVLARDCDGCDAIVLGCAGMTGLAGSLSDDLGIPVVDGVTAAVKMVESLVALGLRTSKRDEYAAPPAKPVLGMLSGFSLPGQ